MSAGVRAPAPRSVNTRTAFAFCRVVAHSSGVQFGSGHHCPSFDPHDAYALNGRSMAPESRSRIWPRCLLLMTPAAADRADSLQCKVICYIILGTLKSPYIL